MFLRRGKARRSPSRSMAVGAPAPGACALPHHPELALATSQQ